MSIRHTHIEFDAIIIGGGLAGIHLALAMDRLGLKPLVVDQPDAHSSSRIAAGIINPITGRRFALTWLYDELEPVFNEVYRYWENKWKTQFFRTVKIFRSIPGNKLVNDLDAKLLESKYQIHSRKMEYSEIDLVSSFIDFQAPGYVMNGYQLDTEAFLNHAIDYLKSRDSYIEGIFGNDQTYPETGPFLFRDFVSQNLIFATGASIVNNKYFNWVRMNPNKGEVVIFRAEGWDTEDIVKQSSFFVPMEQNRIWTGSFNTWEAENRQPTTQGYSYLVNIIDRTVNVPVQIEDHLAAIRPAVEDRRPVIGSHPENGNLFLFNGFGSKGSSLIPFFARQMVEYLQGSDTIHPEADLKRFWPGGVNDMLF